MNFSLNIIDNINSNSGTVSVTRKGPYRLTTTTKNSGFENEQRIYNIKGSTTSKKRLTIATISIESTSDKSEFIQTPSLKSSSNLKLKLVSSVQKTATFNPTRKYISSYVFDVVYFNTVSVSSQDNVFANLIYKQSLVPTRDGGAVNVIKQIKFGSSYLRKEGEIRNIDVIGSPGATATITIRDDNGDSILDNREFTELDDPNATGQYTFSNIDTTYSSGVESRAYSLTIGSSGKESFKQFFPSIVSKATAVNGTMAASGATKIKFDDLTGVKVGDRVILSASPNQTADIQVTELNPDGDDVNECTVSSSITAADDAGVSFQRSRTYDINIQTSSGLGALVPTTSPTYRLYQHRDPILTIRIEGNSTYTIDQFNGVATGLGTGTAHPHEKKYSGTAGFSGEKVEQYSGTKKSIDFSYRITEASGGKNITAFNIPNFNNSVDSELEPVNNVNKVSDWTNSVVRTNGFTSVDIHNVSISSLPASSVTISGTLTIKSWGYKDVTMALDPSKLITIP